MFRMCAVNFILLLKMSHRDIVMKKIPLAYIVMMSIINLGYVFLFCRGDILFHLMGLLPGMLIYIKSAAADNIGIGDCAVIGCIGLILGMKKVTAVILIAIFMALVNNIGSNKIIPFIPYIAASYLIVVLYEIF